MYQNEYDKRKKNGFAGNTSVNFNNKDYTQDFIKMGNAAKGQPNLQKQLYETQRQKEKYMKRTDFTPLIQKAQRNNRRAEVEYYQNLQNQKQADPVRYQNGARVSEPAQQAASFSASKPDYSKYLPDYQHRINTTNDPTTVARDLQLRQEKMDFLMNNDIQALINAETDPEKKAVLEELRKQKLDLLAKNEVTPQSLQGQAAAFVGDNTGKVNSLYNRAENKIKGYADNYQKWAEGQITAAEKKAEGDADRAIKELYASYYQQDLPELERRMARMGGASASGFSRQEALLAQQGLLEDKNDILAEKSRTIAEAENQARELISQGRTEEGKLLAQLAQDQAAAVQKQMQEDSAATREYYQTLNDNEMQHRQWEHSDADREDQQAFTAQENEKEREHHDADREDKQAFEASENEKNRRHDENLLDKKHAFEAMEKQLDRGHDFAVLNVTHQYNTDENFQKTEQELKILAAKHGYDVEVIKTQTGETLLIMDKQKQIDANARREEHQNDLEIIREQGMIDSE